ncbi:enoyl-CoA hydratase-related protein [Gordonia rubripertincta]|uniref:Enoyl-CoA hydratase-related protein n=2 Tax=Gordonia rubripertincta TaxID=36822 RepID=A0AAW6RCA0_GORRU|nr:enoyl-CoA hydratase-related protein [Gordonia rubripertincta]ASR03058.1 1,2-epoxyphenylacetyl-CoA isomerase [Gordonia rubripertincta]MDG6782156.1 enoyl-CoA hydratase-related protein [Gordonia rubripertincta]NKY64717.1 enoyl-CoA hydratase [Gordonia rubripertincta]GAB86305.1 putative enoyl-CoA hydratase [Gordonia rubripertincta NBRC 101908]
MSFVSYRFESGCARITLTDGDRGNPVHSDMVEELFAAVRRASADSARVIVLSAQGRFFSVGGDLAAFASAADMSNYIDDLADSLHRVVSELVRADAVVVSVVQGPAAGAGFPLAAAADIIIAAQTATFSLGYTKVGLNVDGGTSLLVHSLGLHRSLRLALLNDAISADEALATGLVARVAPDGDLDRVAEKIVDQVLAGPAGGQAATKQLLRATADAAPESALRREALAIRTTAGDPDAREGVGAFLAKRRPEFAR